MAHLALAGGTPVRQTAFPRWPVWDTAEIDAVTAVIESGRWGADRGTEVHAFEQEFAAYQDAAFGIAVVNGTVALKLALTAAGVGVGDEVIVPCISGSTTRSQHEPALRKRSGSVTTCCSAHGMTWTTS